VGYSLLPASSSDWPGYSSTMSFKPSVILAGSSRSIWIAPCNRMHFLDFAGPLHSHGVFEDLVENQLAPSQFHPLYGVVLVGLSIGQRGSIRQTDDDGRRPGTAVARHVQQLDLLPRETADEVLTPGPNCIVARGPLRNGDPSHEQVSGKPPTR
jgi:hypothetical protein